MVDKTSASISVRKQCELLGVNRATVYYKPRGESAENLQLMRLIDEAYLKYPFYGSRKMTYVLNRLGYKVGRHRVRRLMTLMGLTAIYQKPNTSQKNQAHEIYPYLLRNKTVDQPNQVWASDITYIPMKHGFMYLTAIIDWYSRKVLSWRLSNTLDKTFCIEALEEAIEKYGLPEIFNTDQGCQYTSVEFTSQLKQHNIQISMDGKGSWRDNVMIERVWRSLKYECIYLQEFDTVNALKSAVGKWMHYYNHERPHATFNGQTPQEIYNGKNTQESMLSWRIRAA